MIKSSHSDILKIIPRLIFKLPQGVIEKYKKLNKFKLRILLLRKDKRKNVLPS